MTKKLRLILGITCILIGALLAAIYMILANYDYNRLKPIIADAVRDATGRELNIRGYLELEIGFTPALVLTDLDFQNAPWGSRPELAKIKRLEAMVKLWPLLSGKIEMRRLVLVEPDILLETNKHGKSNLSFEAPKKTTRLESGNKQAADRGGKLPALGFNEWQVEKGRLTYRDGQSEKTYQVALDQATATPTGSENLLQLKLKAEYGGEPIHATGIIGPAAALVEAGKKWTIDLKVEAGSVTGALNGSVRDLMAQRGIDLVFSFESQEPNKLRYFAIEPLPLGTPLSISGHLNDTGSRSYKISDLKVLLGKDGLAGVVDMDLAKRPVQVTANLHSKRLDLRPLLKRADWVDGKEGRSNEPSKKSERVFPEDPLPFNAWGQHGQGTVKLQIGQLLLPRLALNDLRTEISLRDGQLDIKPIKAILGGGRLNGSVAVQSQGKAAMLRIELKGEGLELGPMLKQLKITEMLEGTLNLDIAIKGRGRSAAALMADLKGESTLIMGRGRLYNKYIDLLGDLSAGIFKLFRSDEEAEEYTEINCAVSRFEIDQGLAESRVLLLDTDRVSIVGEGEIDLKTERLDLSLTQISKEGVGISGIAKLNLSLGELVDSFRLGGTLAEPSLTLDPAGSVITLGKAIGGVALFGPFGILAALVGGTKGDKNLCQKAVEASKKGISAPESKEQEEKKDVVEKKP